MNLLTVIPFRINDAPQAERLCDFIFHQNGQQQLPAVLLVCDAGVHGEMREKIKISAGIAFESVRMIVAPILATPMKSEAVKQRFEFAARYVAQHYQWPWVWLEPDSVPLHQGWLRGLAKAFEEQPYLACAAHLHIKDDGKDDTIPTRIGVYSSRIVALPQTISSVGRTPAIQHLLFEENTNLGKIRPDAVVLHPDKGGHLIARLTEQLQVEPPKRRGRPPKVKQHEQTEQIVDG